MDIEKMLEESKRLALENPKDSYQLALKVLKIAKANRLETEIGFAYFHLAYACRVMSEYSNGLEYALSALNIFQERDNKPGQLKARNIIGIIYFYFSDYSSALENFMEALELLKGIDDPNLESSILNNIGEVYRMANEGEKAISFYEKALAIAVDSDLDLNASAIYLNIGEILFLEHKHQESLVNITKAHKLASDQNSLVLQGEVETKLGRAMYTMKDYDSANKYYLSAMNEFNNVHNKFYLIDLILNLASLDEATGRCPLDRLNEALKIATEMELISKVSLTYNRLAMYHESIHEYKEALEYYKFYHLKEKELEATNLSIRLKILSIELNFNKEKSENESNKRLSEKLKRDVIITNAELEKIKSRNAFLVKENIIDELTQTYNRRGIYQMFESNLVKKSGYQTGVFIIDIDHFKKYNDTKGHIQGDICLKMIASSLDNMDYMDYFVGRFGGDEFICSMKVGETSDAVSIGEDIRKSIEDLKLEYSKVKGFEHVTVSIGGIVGAIETFNIKEIVEKADKELYRAKEDGRNRVCIKVF